MAMRQDTLHDAGAFDAGMPDWGSEDLELCIRYWLLGYQAWVVPQVIVRHYFRSARPYEVTWRAVTHNLLRVAFLHFDQARITQVLDALKDQPHFIEAIAAAVDSDVWARRASLAARRVRDDDWLVAHFDEQGLERDPLLQGRVTEERGTNGAQRRNDPARDARYSRLQAEELHARVLAR